MLLTKEFKGRTLFAPFRAKECWASPKGVSLSAESDKGVALKTYEGLRPSTLRAAFTSKAGVEKARAKLLIVFWEVHQLT